MKKHISTREYSRKVTEAALFAIDMIKTKRQKGMTNDRHIAERLGFASQAITYWRQGTRSITLDQLCALIHEFDIDPKFLTKQQGSVWGDADLYQRIIAVEVRVELLEKQLKNGKKRP